MRLGISITLKCLPLQHFRSRMHGQISSINSYIFEIQQKNSDQISWFQFTLICKSLLELIKSLLDLAIRDFYDCIQMNKVLSLNFMPKGDYRRKL
ncbi:CLUMA_CG014742, isoform A [Clunio marinus]|uniref:CLUMA_CG014742, isoform A n=1 Tax=Clunio marinus TaxID=568069 RepID=A0A1J1IR42_9DIPT|nr:CLUMA_CG014742, isoform A [Clunio marinus]